jgi:hypothetical protein
VRRPIAAHLPRRDGAFDREPDRGARRPASRNVSIQRGFRMKSLTEPTWHGPCSDRPRAPRRRFPARSGHRMLGMTRERMARLAAGAPLAVLALLSGRGGHALGRSAARRSLAAGVHGRYERAGPARAARDRFALRGALTAAPGAAG